MFLHLSVILFTGGGLCYGDPGQRPPWTETPLWTETLQIDTTRTETPPGQRLPRTDPLDKDPPDKDTPDRDPPDRDPQTETPHIGLPGQRPPLDRDPS